MINQIEINIKLVFFTWINVDHLKLVFNIVSFIAVGCWTIIWLPLYANNIVKIILKKGKFFFIEPCAIILHIENVVWHIVAGKWDIFDIINYQCIWHINFYYCFIFCCNETFSFELNHRKFILLTFPLNSTISEFR